MLLKFNCQCSGWFLQKRITFILLHNFVNKNKVLILFADNVGALKAGEKAKSASITVSALAMSSAVSVVISVIVVLTVYAAMRLIRRARGTDDQVDVTNTQSNSGTWATKFMGTPTFGFSSVFGSHLQQNENELDNDSLSYISLPSDEVLS